MRRVARGPAWPLAVAAFALASCAAGPPSPPPAGSPPDSLAASGPSAGQREGAGSSLLPLAPTRVRRAFEEVRLTREKTHWRADCWSVFVGGPVPETVTFGLPEFEVGGDSLGGSTLSDLEFRLDGVVVAPSPAPAPEQDVGAPVGIRHFHSWRVAFATEEVRVARVRFRLVASRSESGEEFLFFYLNPGTPWAGPSGRVNLEVVLGDGGTRDLVADWVRPDGFFVTGAEAVWRLDAEEPVQDLVIARRAPSDWLAGVPDRREGLLSLSPEERSARLAAGTPREWSFWRAQLWARHGDPGVDPEWAARLAAEPWARALAAPEPVAQWPSAERLLLADLEDRLEAWQRRGVPDPEAARDLAAPGGSAR